MAASQKSLGNKLLFVSPFVSLFQPGGGCRCHSVVANASLLLREGQEGECGTVDVPGLFYCELCQSNSAQALQKPGSVLADMIATLPLRICPSRLQSPMIVLKLCP